MTILSWKTPSRVTTFRRQWYATHKRLPHCSQVCRSGVKVVVNCASGLGVRRAIVFLLLVTKASVTTLTYTSCQEEFSVQRFFAGYQERVKGSKMG
jgi:hypothetical protein